MPKQYLGMAAGTRRRFLLRAGSAAAAASVLGPLPARADADVDLAHVRLAVAGERLLLAFERRLLAGAVARPARVLVERLQRNDDAHARALGAVLGDEAPEDGDFEFRLPAAAFRSARASAAFGTRLARAQAAAYLGSVAAVESPGLRSLLARAGAAETGHVAVWASLAGRLSGGPALPRPVALEQASDALAEYLA